MTGPSLNIAFFGHDALESTIVKRSRGFAEHGCQVVGFMFRRHRADLRLRLECPVVDLGTTRDRSYLRRLPRLFVGVWRARQARSVLEAADVFYARNLDMLCVAFAVRLFSGARGRLVYEVLDIQRPLLRPGLTGGALRWVERQVLRRCSLLVVSSPAFVNQYFVPRQRFGSDWLLLENKVPASSRCPGSAPEAKQSGPPWIIGWFGTLRCRRSFRMLCTLADDLGPAVEIRIGGRPSPSDLSPREIETEIARRPNMSYLGGYENPQDLPTLYGPVHFAWCVDYIDIGTNSDWLIPNRIYEGGLYGAVALGRRGTMTGQVIEDRGLGCDLTEPVETSARALLEHLTAASYAVLHDRLSGHPRGMFVDERDTAALVARLEGLTGSAGGPKRRVASGSCVPSQTTSPVTETAEARVDAGPSPDAAACEPCEPAGLVTRITVIIPFYQREVGILARALRSVALQRFDRPVDLLVIVVDDGSPCSPERELEGVPPSLSVRIVTRPNGGPGAARNTGLDNVPAATEAVAFLDSDDVWAPGHLAGAVHGLGTDCDFYFCDHLRPDGVSSHFEATSRQSGDLLGIAERGNPSRSGTSRSLTLKDGRRLISGNLAMDAFVERYWAHTSCIVYRLSQNTDLRFDETLRAAGEDYLFTMHLVRNARRICFRRQMLVERGFGLNLYDTAASWNDPHNIKLVFDNFRCFLAFDSTISVDSGLKRKIRKRLSALRVQFIYVFLRRIIVFGKMDANMIRRACSEDRLFLMHVPRVAVWVGAKKALGLHVPELA